MVDTRQQHLSSLQVQISQIIQNLIEENASLKKENDRLRSGNGKLVGMNTSLREENEKLKREHIISQSQVPKFKEERKHLTEKMTQLKSENSELKERVKLQEPLVECAVLIRRRLFERAKCQRGHGDAIDFIIEAGNHAAHRGDFFADIAMFKLGYMKSSEAAASQDEGTTEFERTYMKVFHDLYGSSLDGWWRTILIRDSFSSTELEFWNLCATMSITSPLIQGPCVQPVEFQVFKMHAADFIRVHTHIDDSTTSKLALWAALDVSQELEAKLQGMREIVERTVQKYKGRNGAWKLKDRDLSRYE